MKRFVFFLFISTQFLLGQQFDEWFEPATMRMDYYRITTKNRQLLTLDAVYRENVWAGSRKKLIDTVQYGDDFVTVHDRSSGRMIYSRGFSTLSGEWQTTEEALSTWRTFHESVRFPFPKKEIIVTLYKRDSLVGKGKPRAFRKIQEFIIDPRDSVRIRRDIPPTQYSVLDLHIAGPVEKAVDLLIVGDGYSQQDIEKFRADAKHFMEKLFATYPLIKYKNKFNVRALEVVSAESGIDKPDLGIWKNNALGTQYNTFGSARYILTEDNKTLRNIIASVPYDVVTILVNDNRYGGGGIYNLYTTCFTIPVKEGQEWEMDYVYVHEFGHCFAGLGDEYYSSQISYIDFYPPDVEPWEPNLTRSTRRGEIKWSRLIDVSMPLPTPWQKALYDSLETERGKLDRLSPDYYSRRESLLVQTKAILNHATWKGRVGLFEGAGYLSKGMYRPALDCKMFSLNPVDFDPVCSAAIELMIEFNTD